MADLHRIESPNSPFIGGILATFPSGASKSLTWRSETPIHDTLAMGKELAARALQDRLDVRAIDDAERTNWASFAAACAKHVGDWNAALRTALAKGAAARLEAGG